MAEIGIKDLKANASRVIGEVVAGATYVVTKRGKPAAVILPVEDAEDLVLAHAAELVRMHRKSRGDYRNGRAVTLEDEFKAGPISFR